MIKNILFVCTGNTCRSPIAEELFKVLLKRYGETETEVSSAGISAFTGDAISENSALVLAEYGVSGADKKRSRALDFYSIQNADLIVCMNESHSAVLKSAGVESEKIRVLGISDPYGCNLEVYRNCAKEIFSKLKGIFCEISNINIFPFSPGDEEGIAEIEKAAFSSPWSKTAIKDSAKSGTVFFTAKRDGEIIGFSGVQLTADGGYVTNIAVKKEWQGLYLGKLLTEKLIDECSKKCLPQISLEVRISNQKAINLYTSLGFEKAGIRKNFYINPKEDALILTKEL